MSSNSGPGYRTQPGHRITIQPAGARVQVTFNGEVIADSENAVRLDESNHAPVYYLPREDVNMDRFVRTAHSTYCPFKGQASYYTVSCGGRTAKDVCWSYEQPYDEVSGIRKHLAFYRDKVDSITVAASNSRV
jgi:uncharacterized protein (DUF427 family)